MPKSLRHRLLEKGWSEEEIEKTLHILTSEEKLKKHEHYAHKSHPILYWAGLVIAIIGNFLLSVTFIPFLMILNSLQLYIILGVVGVVFGAMFNTIIKDIEHVDQSHHLMAGVFIPAIAVINVYVMVNVANKFSEIIQSEISHSAVVMSIIYIACFSGPYFIYKVKDLIWERKQRLAA